MSSKEQQRKSLALIVIAVIFFIYTERVLLPHLNGSDANKVVDPKVESSSSVGKEPAKEEIKNTPVSSKESAVVVDDVTSSSDEVIVNTYLQEIKLSKKGGRIISIKLKNFAKNAPDDPERFDMISHKAGTEYPGGISLGDVSDLTTNYVAKVDDQSRKVSFVGTLSNGKKVEKSFHFKDDSYLFDFNAKSLDGDTSPITFQWLNLLSSQEAKAMDSYNVVGFVWLQGDLAERLHFENMKDDKLVKSIGCAEWVGLGDKYFATAVLSPEYEPSNKQSNALCSQNTYPIAQMERKAEVAVMKYLMQPSSEGVNYKVYSGPKSYPTLEKEGYELKRLVDLGKTGFVSAPLLSFLNFFFKYVGNYGLAIVLLTICVKLCLYPLNTAQFKQMKAMQDLKPELDRIKDNIKDKQQQQMAMMELYKKRGVNPLGGCLPALIQMPIFIGLYSALMLAVELRHAHYGIWVHDLSAPDKLMVGGVGVPVLVVLFTLSIMVQQWITPANIDPAQKKAMMIMPVLMFFMFMNFPAGLALYWLTNNLISIGQQQAIRYSDKSGKSGLSITLGVAAAVYALAFICTKL